MDPDQTAPIGAVCSGSTLFASILNSSVMLGNYLQQTTSADDIFRCIFFLGLKGLKNQTHLIDKFRFLRKQKIFFDPFKMHKIIFFSRKPEKKIRFHQ